MSFLNLMFSHLKSFNASYRDAESNSSSTCQSALNEDDDKDDGDAEPEDDSHAHRFELGVIRSLSLLSRSLLSSSSRRRSST